MRQVRATATSTKWNQAKQRTFNDFVKFCNDELAVDDVRNTDGRHVLVYLQHVFDSTTLQATSIDGRASQLLAARTDNGLPPLTDTETRDKAQLLLAFRRLRPGGRIKSVPQSIRALLPSVPRSDAFAHLRDRTIFAIRVVTMMRSSAPLEIRLDSVKRAFNTNGAPIVVFQFKSKATKARGVEYDSNYVEFMDPRSPNSWLCPAANLLKLIDNIHSLAIELRKPVPDTFCVDEYLRVMSPGDVSRVVKNIMRKAGWLEQSKDLRRASEQCLRNWRSESGAAIPIDDIYLRGGWKNVASAVVHNHYSDFRLVAANFADALLG
jgi:hypothetical protein